MEAIPAREPSLQEKNAAGPSPSKPITNPSKNDNNAPIPEETSYLTSFKLVVIMSSLCLCNFLIALDTTIIATAIPVISERFHALQDVGWYVSAYFLTNCAFQLLYGKLCTLYAVNWIYIGAVAIFEIGSLICAFITLQFLGGENATVPTSVLKQRSMLFGMFYMFCVGAHFLTLVYFLPIWFQGVRGSSALQSGVDTLPILEVNSSPAKRIGYQIIYGVGGGLGYQQGITATQTVLGPTEVAIGTALMVFMQNLGGTIFISAANNVFVTRLVKNLATVAPHLDTSAIVSAVATGFRYVVKSEEYPLVLVAYNGAVIETSKMGLILACLCALGAAGMEWRRASTREKPNEEGEVAQSETAA